MKVVYHPEVEKIIRSLSEKDESRVMNVIDLFLDYRFHLPQTYLKKITREIWELRTGRYRLLFGIINGDVVVVVFFMKKTRKTPKQDIERANRRLKQYAQ